MKINSLLLIISFVLAITLLNCKSGKDGTLQVKEVQIPVKVITTETKEISIPIHSAGRLFPQSTVKLSFKTGGLIKNLYKQAGDRVKKGDVIAELDLSEINGHYQKARRGFEKATRDLKRVTALHKDQAATIEQMQNTQTAFDVATANLKIARFNLDHSRIKAPDDGKILGKLAENNELIAAGHPVYLFGSTIDSWIVKCGVSEKNLLKIAVNDRADIKLAAYEKTIPGKVIEISNSIDRNSGNYEIRIQISDPTIRLVSGFTASVDIYPTKTEQYTLVPYNCLVDSAGSDSFVFTVEKGKARKIAVTIGHLFNNYAAVQFKKGVPVKLVSEGTAYLIHGSKVREIK